jgi:hypothetical protein
MTKKPYVQKKKANGRYEGTNYRYSTKFINRLTGWLIAWIFIGTGIGLGLGALGDTIYSESEVPDWYSIIAIGFVISGVALPLLIGAWFGAMAINKYAGPIGLLLVLGIGATAVGSTAGDAMWVWIGIGAMVLSVLLFFYIGFQAKVPIWLQLPILQSPRVYLTKDKASKENPRNVKNIFK